MVRHDADRPLQCPCNRVERVTMDFFPLKHNTTNDNDNKSDKYQAQTLPQKSLHESRVEQVQNSMLFATDVNVHRQRPTGFVNVTYGILVVRVKVADEVPVKGITAIG